MIYSKNGLNLTENFEGCKLKSYPDPGTGGTPWTIGYGHTGPDVHEGMVISQEEAEELLKKDIQAAENIINSKVQEDLNQNEFDALVDFVFNIGAGNFINSTLLKKINDGDMQGAADQFLLWNHSSGKILAGLTKRRCAEKNLFLELI